MPNIDNAALNARRPRRLAALTAALLLSAAAACSSPEEKVRKYTSSALEYLEEGDLGRANVQFQNALNIDEDHIPALEGFAELLEKRQDYKAMYGTLQKIKRLDPNNVVAHVKLGQLYLIGSNEDDALEAAEKVLTLDPDNSAAHALKAAVLLKLDDTAGAIQFANRSLELDPLNTEAVAVLATERSKAEDYEGALKIVDDALGRGNETAILHLLRLQVLSNLGREGELRAGFQSLIAQHPEVVSYRQMYANMLIEEDDLAGAREQLMEIVRINPDQTDPMLDVVRIDYRASGAEAATETFKAFIEEKPDNKNLKFMFAAFLRQQGDAAGAEAIYDALAQEKGPQGLRARDEIAGMRLVEGNREEAERILDAILAEDAQYPGALVKRAGLKVEDEQYDSAIADLRTVINAKPDLTAAKLLMAAALEQKGDLGLAEREFSQAVQDSNNAAEPALLFARFLMRQNEAARAEKVLLDSIAANPNAVNNLKLLAALRLSQQDWQGAEEIAALIEEADEEDASVNRILGATRTGLQDYSGAIDALNEANQQTPLAARPLAMLINAYLKDGRAEEAEQLLAGMVEGDEENYGARILYAQVMGAQGKDAEMEAVLKETLARHPERSEAAQSLFRMYTSKGRFDDAEQMLESAIAAAPDVDDYKVLYADLLLSTNRQERALEVYEDILTRRPDDDLVANNYSSLILELRDDPESLQKALSVAKSLEASSLPYFQDTYGWAQHRTGDHEGAIETLEKAVEADPNFAEGYYHLGAAYLASGDAEKGRENIQRALALAPDAHFSQKARDLLAQN